MSSLNVTRRGRLSSSAPNANVREAIALSVETRRAHKLPLFAEIRPIEDAEISRGYLIRLEAGQQDPTLGTLERLAKALPVPLKRLLG